MASRSRINVKFILILFIVVTTAAGLVGGLWIVKNRTDVARSIRRGDDFMEQGEYRRAQSYYARALGRKPGNLQYLANVERALLKVQPETANEARDLYNQYLSVLRHGADHHPTDPALHLRLLSELQEAAQRSTSWGYSKMMSEYADDMLERVPASNPERVKARLYRGIARVSPWMYDRLTEDEVHQGETDIEEYLEAYPSDDLAWSSLIYARLAARERRLEAAEETRAAEAKHVLDDTIAQAREHVPGRPRTLLAILRVALETHKRNPNQVDEDAARRDLEALVGDVREGDDDSWLITQTALMIERLTWLPDTADSIELLEAFLQRHPEAHDVRLVKATLHYHRSELDKALATTKEITEAGLMTVGFLSQLQFDLKRRALSLNVDIAVRRWDLAKSGERPGLVAAIEQARDILKDATADTENDPLLLRAQGQVAFVQKDFATAAVLFNRLLAHPSGVDFRTKIYAALSLEQQGEIGAASELIDEALEDLPGNTIVMVHQARLHRAMGQYEEAGEILDQVLAAEPENEAALRLKSQLARAENPEGTAEADPVHAAIAQASEAYRDGRYEAARSALLAAQKDAPEDLSLINALIRIEIATGRMDEARRWIDRGLELSPRNRIFVRYKATIDNPDALEAIKAYMATLYDDETERAVETLLALRAVETRYGTLARQFEAQGKTEEATKSRADQQRARTEEDLYRAKVEQLAPDNPRFIEYRFMRALINKAWDEAEKIVEVAERRDLDKAGGALYLGRMNVAKADTAGAIRAFRQATERIPYSATAWRLLAMSYRATGHFAQALNAFEESYKNNPRDMVTLLAYARLLERTGNSTRALLVIRNGRRLAPDNGDLRDLWLTLEGEAGNPSIELFERRRRYAANPADRKNAAALAAFVGRTKPVRELLVDEKGEERFTYERWSRLPVKGRGSQEELLATERTKWLAEADGIVEKLAAPDDRDLAWYRLKAELMRARGDVNGGEELLRTFAAGQEDGPARLEPLLTLGRYQARIDRAASALATYQQALPYQDKQDVKASRAIADLLFRVNQFEDAIPYFETVLAATPSRQTELQIVECLVKTGHLDEAKERLAGIEARTSPDGTSLLLKASILYSEGRLRWQQGEKTEARHLFDEHFKILDQAAAADPSNPMPYIMRAASLYQSFKQTADKALLDDALMALSRADEVQADNDRTSLTRIEILRAKGDTSAAINELQQLLERSPDQFQGRQMLVSMLLAGGRKGAAIEAVKVAVDRNPTATFWRIALGDLFVQAQREAEQKLKGLDRGSAAARQLATKVATLKEQVESNYAAALETTASARILSKWADILMSNDPPEYAKAIETIGAYPKQVESSPTLRAIYARALAAHGERDQALEHLRVAYASERAMIADGSLAPAALAGWYTDMARIFGREGPSAAEAFVMETCGGKPDAYDLRSLAAIWRASGADGLSRSIELIQQAIPAAPEDDPALKAGLYSDLGAAYITSLRYEAAVDAYRQVLQITPDDPQVNNNIAYLYSEMMKDPERGLPFAKKALDLQPTSGSIHDTVGWIYVLLDDLDQAESFLRRSVQIEPNAENHYHLAVVFCRQGKSDLALRHLATAGDLNPNPDVRKQINRLADDIRTGHGCGQ